MVAPPIDVTKLAYKCERDGAIWLSLDIRLASLSAGISNSTTNIMGRLTNAYRTTFPLSIYTDPELIFLFLRTFSGEGAGPIDELRTVIAERQINPSDLSFLLGTDVDSLMTTYPAEINRFSVIQIVQFVCQHPPLEKIYKLFSGLCAKNTLARKKTLEYFDKLGVTFDPTTGIPTNAGDRTHKVLFRTMDLVTEGWFNENGFNGSLKYKRDNALKQICEKYKEAYNIVD